MGTMEGHTQLAAVRPDMLAAWSYQSDIPGRLSRYQQAGGLAAAAKASARTRDGHCRTSCVRCPHDR